jgi:hypothetical protein
MKLLLKLSDMLDFEPSYTATKRPPVSRCRSYKDAKHKECSVRREHSLSIEVFKEGKRDGNSLRCVGCAVAMPKHVPHWLRRPPWH